MKAAVLQGTGQMNIMEWPERELGPEEVRIRVKCCGICGTDQHIYHGQPGSAAVNPPIVLGHELSGEVVACGADVTSLQPGDRVSVDPNMYCGGCEYCRTGRPQLCERLQAIGVTRDGGMGELCVVPAANCYKLPDGMSYVEGALVEPLGCVVHGFKKLDVRPVHRVLLIGGGFIGQLFLQLLVASGPAHIAVSEPSVGKHDLLLQSGAQEVVVPTPEMIERLRHSADIVIECVGRKESMELAIQAARKGGQVLLFGVASPQTSIAVSPYEIFTKELRIFGSFINPHTHPDAIALLRRGIVQAERLVSHRFTLDEVPQAMAHYAKLGVVKGVIVHDGR